jgi:hypothetical protein
MINTSSFHAPMQTSRGREQTKEVLRESNARPVEIAIEE